MKILFVEPFGHHPGHHSILTKQLTEALVEAGVNITMVTFDGVRDNWIETSKIEQHISVVSQGGLVAALLRRIPKLHRLPLLGVFADLAETLLTPLFALREAKRQSCEVIHIFESNPIFFPLVPALFTKNHHFVVNIHATPLEWEATGGLRAFIRLLRKREYHYCLHLLMVGFLQSKPLRLLQGVIYRKALKKNRFSFISYSSQIKESLKTYLGGIFYDKIHVIPLGRTPPEANQVSQSQAREYLHLPQKAELFLSFGGYHFHKNMEIIFQAVKDMPKTFYLVFAGKLVTGDKVRDPVRVAKKYGWIDNTIVIGKFIPEAEKPYYFYASDAMMLSFDKGFLCASGTLNEASQFQLPAIASDVGQVGEYVKTYNLGITFAPEDAESLRRAINSFLSLTDGERLTVKANLRTFASSFDSAEMARRYIALYETGSR